MDHILRNVLLIPQNIFERVIRAKEAKVWLDY
ncbi:hypothetical protein [uncultured Gammaproteobacteria bacterium]|nr:hypothetical protein [uncultured Gammaproteobacteria bacterium]